MKFFKNRKKVSKIAYFRQQVGLTQLELSQLLGVTENTIANLEKGRSGLEPIERVIKLCQIFNCKAEDLIEYEDRSESKEPKLDGDPLEEIRNLYKSKDRDPVSTAKSNSVSKDF